MIRHPRHRAWAASVLLAFAAGSLHAQEASLEPTADAPEAQGWQHATVVEGLEHPWGMAFLPGGDILITERPGRMRIIRQDELLDEEVEGVPEVFAQGQGGLLDVVIHPDFEQNRLIYFTYAAGTEEENQTTLARARLEGMELQDVEVLFQAQPAKNSTQHFGSRLLWLRDGTLLMSIGDGGNPPVRVEGILAREHPQRLDSHLGKIIRLNDDGSVPRDNPFVGNPDARPEIYSFGHRNIQGMALDPATGQVYVNEHGPLGGDELTAVQPGENHGWAEATFGRDYRSGERFTPHQTLPETVNPLVVWTPAQAPSGLMFYTGDRFPQWQGDLFSGGLVGEEVRRVVVENGEAVEQESLPLDRRVRDVVQGPDGLIYVLTDHEDGELYRLAPR